MAGDSEVDLTHSQSFVSATKDNAPRVNRAPLVVEELQQVRAETQRMETRPNDQMDIDRAKHVCCPLQERTALQSKSNAGAATKNRTTIHKSKLSFWPITARHRMPGMASHASRNPAAAQQLQQQPTAKRAAPHFQLPPTS